MKWGYIDERGEMQIPPMYEWAASFHSGLALVRSGQHYGYINHQGEVSIPCTFGRDSTDFLDDSAVVETENGMLAFIDRVGKFLLDRKFEYAEPFVGRLAYVILDDERFYIDRQGNKVIAGIYEGESFSCGFAPVLRDEGWYYMDDAGEVMSGPFEHASGFEDGYALCRTNQQNVIIATDGSQLKLSRGKVGPVCSGHRFSFQENELEGFLTETGEVVIPAQFDEVRSFRQERCSVRVGDRWGVIDMDGQWIVEPSFESVGLFFDGYSQARLRGSHVCLRTDGTVAFRFSSDAVGDFSEGLAPVGIS